MVSSNRNCRCEFIKFWYEKIIEDAFWFENVLSRFSFNTDSQFAHKQFENEDDQDIVDDSTAAIAKAAPLNQRH